MDCVKEKVVCFAVGLCIFSGGCAGSAVVQRDARSGYMEGYRKGVAENLGNMVEALNGNDFPYLGETWNEPLVQNVDIPAHVENGVFYPRHQEPVIIAPGEWKKSGAFPLASGTKSKIVVREESAEHNITPLPGEFFDKEKGEQQ